MRLAELDSAITKWEESPDDRAVTERASEAIRRWYQKGNFAIVIIPNDAAWAAQAKGLISQSQAAELIKLGAGTVGQYLIGAPRIGDPARRNAIFTQLVGKEPDISLRMQIDESHI